MHVRFQRQPKASHPAIYKLNKIAEHAFVGFINQRVAINIHIFQPLITGRAFSFFRTDNCYSKAMAAQACGFLPDTPVEGHRQVLHDDQDIALSCHTRAPTRFPIWPPVSLLGMSSSQPPKPACPRAVRPLRRSGAPRSAPRHRSIYLATVREDERDVE